MAEEPWLRGLRVLRADNPSALTLDGTRTHLVGSRSVAVIDPGPGLSDHLDAVAAEVSGAASVVILLTHGHPDHGEGAPALAERLGAPLRAMHDGTLAEGDRIATDAGELVAVSTPGHSPDHAAFHWPAAGAAFCGDLMLGGLDTALVAPPEGELGAYLASLERLRALEPRWIMPAHGPPFSEPDSAIAAYLRHRQNRLERVLAVLSEAPARESAVAETLYGSELPEELRGVARQAARAYLLYLEGRGSIERVDDSWRLGPEEA